MELTTALTIFGAIGGAETVKWLIGYLTTRKQQKRVKEAEAADAELEVEKDQVGWLENRLSQRDAKIDSLYIELRKEQTEKLELVYKCHALELQLKESEIRRCNVRGCAQRQPPSDF